MRGNGSLFRRGKNRVIWVSYYVNGKRIRESSGSTLEKDARELLRTRMAQVKRGRLPERDRERYTFKQLAALLTDDYAANGRKSTERAKISIKKLESWFGDDRVVAITTGRIKSYVAGRFSEGAKAGTVRIELAALRRMFTLAAESWDGFEHQPHFPKVAPGPARTGFFEEQDLRRVIANLPEELRPPILFAFLTGWRKSEVFNLRWRDVDLDAGVVRLQVGETKNGEGRVLPFDALPELADLIRNQKERTLVFERSTACVVQHVFHRNGRPMLDIRGAWQQACRQAGVPGKLFHDFRRTAVRNLERAGVPRSWAMKLTGHKTESVYQRYAIVSEQDQRDGLARLAASRAQVGHISAFCTLKSGTDAEAQAFEDNGD